MTVPHALWDHLRFQAHLRPNALAVHGPAGPLGYRELVRDVDRLATELLERGLTRQDMVGLHLGISYLHLLLILALDRLSIASMSFGVSRTELPPPGARRQFGVTTIISGVAAPADPPCRWITMPAEPDRSTLGAADDARLGALDRAHDWPADALVRVVWSSGTTGGMKGAPIPRALQGHRIAGRRLARGFGPKTRYLAGVPFASSPGYVLAIAVLAAGGAVLLPRPGMDVITLANEFGATDTSAPPPLLTELVARSTAREQGFTTLDMLMVSGTHLPSALAREALSRLTPHVWVGYGATETCGVSYVDAAITLSDPSAVGFVHPWVDAEIVDSADRPLPAGEEGAVRLRSAQTIAGYVDDDAATRRNFRDGWFYPGDIGSLDARRLLRITGRAEDVIVHDGVTLSPETLEDTIRGFPGVRDVAVFAVPRPDGSQEIGAAFVIDGDTTAEQVRALARERLGDRAPTRLFKLENLPRNPNGKVVRRELAALALRARNG